MSDVSTGQERLRESVTHEAHTRPRPTERGLLATGLALLAICVALFLAWQTVPSLLIIFAGVLFAAFLDAAARAIAPVFRVNRIWRLTLVLVLLTAAIGLGLVWGAGKLPEQTRLLLKVMDAQFDVLQQHFLSYGVDLLGPEWGRDFAQWLVSDQGRFFSHAQRRPWRSVELSGRHAGDRFPRHPLCFRPHQPPRQPRHARRNHPIALAHAG